MATKLCRMMTYLMRLLPIESRDLLRSRDNKIRLIIFTATVLITTKLGMMITCLEMLLAICHMTLGSRSLANHVTN